MEQYKLGAIPNPIDTRDIHMAQVQAPVPYPASYKTDISFIPVLDQKILGACVGHAHATCHIYHEYKETGKVKDLSPRYIYALSKKIDGYPGEGTFPRVSAKIEKDSGCATEDTIINNTTLSHTDYINITETDVVKKDAFPFRIGGYADIPNDKEALKQAIYQNGVVPITISVGNFFNPIIKGNYGWHRVVAFGYDENDRFYFRNSWGEVWGDNGDGYFDWSTQTLIDMLVFTDIPNTLLEDIKKKTVTLTREQFLAKETLGTLTTDDFVCKTLELPWLNNQSNISCIPDGTYSCKWEINPKFGLSYRLSNVIGRDGILGHAGNYYTDILGCILHGDKYSDTNKDGIVDVLNSRVTLDKLYKVTGETFMLVIKSIKKILPTEVLIKGSRGANVKILQKALALTPDGIFGKNTERAVKGFQANNQLVADGVVGKNTWAKLKSLIK